MNNDATEQDVIDFLDTQDGRLGTRRSRPQSTGTFHDLTIWEALYTDTTGRQVKFYICPAAEAVGLSNDGYTEQMERGVETAFATPDDFAVWVLGALYVRQVAEAIEFGDDDSPRLFFNDQGQLPSA